MVYEINFLSQSHMSLGLVFYVILCLIRFNPFVTGWVVKEEAAAIAARFSSILRLSNVTGLRGITASILHGSSGWNSATEGA